MTTELEGLPAWARKRSIGEYGGSTDKTDSNTERVPYAYTWYREMIAMRGSAFRKEQDGLVHAENLAMARVWAGVSRAAERLENNANPITSAERLGYWVRFLGVAVFPGDSRHDIRQRCAAKYQGQKGATEKNVEDAVTRLLGESFVKVHRQRGVDLDNPPAQTFWPGVNPGPPAYSLGGGAWLSERAHLVIEVVQFPGQTLAEFLRLMNVDLFQLLDLMLPSSSTFDWAINVENGFLLDLDDMDFAGMG